MGNAAVNQLIRNLESSFDTSTPSRETRLFLKLNEQLGRHSLSQEVNYTNGNVKNFAPLSDGNSVPSTRTDRGARNLLLAFGDTMLLGDQGDPWIVTLRGAYRGELFDRLPAHPGGRRQQYSYGLSGSRDWSPSGAGAITDGQFRKRFY